MSDCSVSGNFKDFERLKNESPLIQLFWPGFSLVDWDLNFQKGHSVNVSLPLSVNLNVDLLDGFELGGGDGEVAELLELDGGKLNCISRYIT